MILVLDTEIDPAYRYIAREIAHHTPAKTDCHVFVEDPAVPDLDACDGVILSGSTASVYDEADHEAWLLPEFELVRQCIETRVPLLGICFGHQAINVALGGTVRHDTERATFVEMETLEDDGVLAGVNSVVPAYHGDLVTDLGTGMVTTARTSYSDHFCTRHETAPCWTVQFHPEFTPRVTGDAGDHEFGDWHSGDHSFAACNATRVLENFVDRVDARS